MKKGTTVILEQEQLLFSPRETWFLCHGVPYWKRSNKTSFFNNISRTSGTRESVSIARFVTGVKKKSDNRSHTTVTMGDDNEFEHSRRTNEMNEDALLFIKYEKEEYTHTHTRKLGRNNVQKRGLHRRDVILYLTQSHALWQNIVEILWLFFKAQSWVTLLLKVIHQFTLSEMRQFKRLHK